MSGPLGARPVIPSGARDPAERPLAVPALAQAPKSDMDLALAKAKKEKKLVTLVFTQFG